MLSLNLTLSTDKEYYGAIQEPPWEIQLLFISFKNMPEFDRVWLLLVDRQANQAADWVASISKWKMCPLSWVTSPSSPLVEILIFRWPFSPS